MSDDMWNFLDNFDAKGPSPRHEQYAASGLIARYVRGMSVGRLGNGKGQVVESDVCEHLTGRTSEFSNIESRLCCATSYKLAMFEDSFLPNSEILVPRQSCRVD